MLHHLKLITSYYQKIVLLTTTTGYPMIIMFISSMEKSKKMKISVVIHTYNAEKYLERCIKSVLSADEIIICDMYSTDKTVEIAQKYNCKIVYQENMGFAEPARNFANSQVTSDYFLILDADEYASEGLIEYLRNFVTEHTDLEGIKIPYKNEVLGKVLTSYSKPGIFRFFKRGCVNYQPIVHAIPEVKGKVITLPCGDKKINITHTMVDDIGEHAQKWNYYTTLELEKMIARGKKFSIPFLINRTIGEFFKLYLLKGGYKDGIHGFIFAGIGANYKFMSIAKLWEYELKNKSQN